MKYFSFSLMALLFLLFSCAEEYPEFNYFEVEGKKIRLEKAYMRYDYEHNGASLFDVILVGEGITITKEANNSLTFNGSGYWVDVYVVSSPSTKLIPRRYENRIALGIDYLSPKITLIKESPSDPRPTYSPGRGWVDILEEEGQYSFKIVFTTYNVTKDGRSELVEDKRIVGYYKGTIEDLGEF